MARLRRRNVNLKKKRGANTSKKNKTGAGSNTILFVLFLAFVLGVGLYLINRTQVTTDNKGAGTDAYTCACSDNIDTPDGKSLFDQCLASCQEGADNAIRNKVFREFDSTTILGEDTNEPSD